MKSVTLTLNSGNAAEIELRLCGPADYIVGRASRCDICLSEMDQWHLISRRHCLFSVEFNLSVVDLGSLNGTYVNGQKLTPNECIYLRENDRVAIGEIILTVKTAVDSVFEDAVVEMEQQNELVT